MPLEKDVLNFAIEEYKSVREEQLLRVREMDLLLFRTIGVCALLYTLVFVDASATNPNTPILDGRILQYLIFFPPVIIFLAGLDYVRRLQTLILISRYLARLEAEIYAADRKAKDWIIAETDGKVRVFTIVRSLFSRSGASPPPHPDIAHTLNQTLGYSVFQLVKNRFNEANAIRYTIWILMFFASLGLIFARDLLFQ